tara:strand:- start:187 stop:552 length:366 start_codon:yes stop_codon:yes gene_type:complete
MAEKKNKLNSMPLQRLEDMLYDGTDQLMVAEELLYHILKQETYNPWLVATLCDVYSANHKLVSEIDGIMENCYINKEDSDEDKWKIVLSPEDIMILETIMVARYYTSREILDKGNLSLSIH